jgi:hypothetical protein
MMTAVVANEGFRPPLAQLPLPEKASIAAAGRFAGASPRRYSDETIRHGHNPVGTEPRPTLRRGSAVGQGPTNIVGLATGAKTG